MIEYNKISGIIYLSEDRYENIVQVENEDFELMYLNPKKKGNKGASSNLFILNDPTGETEDRVIKICKAPYYKRSRDRRIARFKREIDAFKRVRREKISGIITYHTSGIIAFGEYDLLYIVLELAQGDLSSYMEDNKFDFTLNQKFTFCLNIINNFRQLHSAGIYHRDIKHDNILLVNGEFKIGDLGLVDFQDPDVTMDLQNEKIGPTGWLSPEATNKMLTYGKEIGNIYDCFINHSSDIFQLGKLFWYIFQGNLPIGQLNISDKRFESDDIFQIIMLMIQYEKSRRPEINKIIELFEPIRLKLLA